MFLTLKMCIVLIGDTGEVTRGTSMMRFFFSHKRIRERKYVWQSFLQLEIGMMSLMALS